MSASEKLKALAEETPRGPALLESYYETVSAVLPQIVAVVWEAESTCMDCGPCNGGVTPPEDGSPCWNCGTTRLALSALNEALSSE